ncbi:concanavalin A-like lectin/glucanase domain-containing protein [Xylariales sp. PMI_506]|nr:concanavalin A-like lectin/glucanase domain-containing protein [Xylariales sp. PMI_506]
MLRSLIPIGIVLAGVSSVLADTTQSTCSLTQHCPEEAPCCSQYGQCGVGAYCLGGCDPRMSFSLDSCVPAPVCVSKTLPMSDTKGVIDVSKYLGDPTSGDWVAQGTAVPYGGNTLLTMAPNTAGTVLASTSYLWYGNVTAKVKTGRGAGVVTAFILLSDVKDEIDYEWVGTELDIAQTNYYFQGIPDYTHSANITSLSDTNANFHEYEIRWTPDDITWLVDGKSDTWNASANQWNFPQTPARVQLSIWPGTIDWAGGPIDWDSEDIQKDGYYYATFGEVDIACYQTNTPPGTNSGTSYTYDSWLGTNDTVIDGDKPTILKSLLGTGLNMSAGASTSSSSTAAVIPGLSGAGPGTNGETTDTGSSGSTGTGSSSPASCTSGGFSQDCSSSSSSSTGGTKNEGVRQDRVLGASAFAALIAVAAMLAL